MQTIILEIMKTIDERKCKKQPKKTKKRQRGARRTEVIVTE